MAAVHYFFPKSAFPHNTGERNLKQLRPDMAIVPMVAGQYNAIERAVLGISRKYHVRVFGF